MTWKTITPQLAKACSAILDAWRKHPDYLSAVVPPGSSLGNSNQIASMLRTWVETVRAANPNSPFYGPAWLPSETDIYKSALFERIRSGLDPLEEPPPIGLACPWYAVVEDPGPHFVYDVKEAGAFGQWFEDLPIKPDVDIFVLNTGYRVTEKIGPKDLIIRDGRRDTSYRFHLWYDPEFTWPGRMASRQGGWLMRNMEFENAQLD